MSKRSQIKIRIYVYIYIYVFMCICTYIHVVPGRRISSEMAVIVDVIDSTLYSQQAFSLRVLLSLFQKGHMYIYSYVHIP